VTTEMPENLLSREYHAAREAYWDAQKEFRALSIAEVQRLMPAGVSACVFTLSDDPEVPRLTLDTCLDAEGEEHPAFELEESGVYDTIDQLAADMEAFSWEEANSFLLRAEDRDRFIIHRPEETPS
jgi:hypothetical protein